MQNMRFRIEEDVLQQNRGLEAKPDQWLFQWKVHIGAVRRSCTSVMGRNLTEARGTVRA